MKKIKHLSQLRSEQRRLRQHETELEKEIKKDWREVRETLRPRNIGKEFLSSFITRKTQEKISSNDILTGSLSYGAAMFTKKLAEKVEEKITRLFGK